MHRHLALAALLAACASPEASSPAPMDASADAAEALEPARRSEPIATEPLAPIATEPLAPSATEALAAGETADVAPRAVETPGALAPVEPGLEIEGEGDAARLIVHGVPALRGDGRVLVTLDESDDYAAFVYTDVRTGRELRREPYPGGAIDAHAEEVVWEIDDAAARRIAARWQRDAYRSLVALDREPSRDEQTAQVYANEIVRVETIIRPPSDDQDWTTRVVVTDARTGAVLEDVVHDTADTVNGVMAAPDGSFVVVAESFCACECASWATLVRLAR